MKHAKKYLTTIKMMPKTGPIENAIIKLTLHKKGSRKLTNLQSLLTKFSKTYLDYPKRKADIFERLKQLIPSSQIFTVRQKRILRDFMNIGELAGRSLKTLRAYDEARYFIEALIRYYEVLPESETQLQELRDIQSELGIVYLVVQLVLRTPIDEARMIDEYTTYLNGIIERYMAKKGVVDCELLRIEETKKRKEFDTL